MNRQTAARWRAVIGLLGLLAWSPLSAQAGGPVWHRTRTRSVVPTAVPAQPGPYPGLGTFYPSPTMFVRGNSFAGGGYSPLGIFGDATMVIYGPLSSLRATAAPVQTYARGYDGRPVILEGTSFSTPNLPGATPVVYPTQATYYYGFKESYIPPWWPSAINWIDQN
jgi:hypothetical protein